MKKYKFVRELFHSTLSYEQETKFLYYYKNFDYETAIKIIEQHHEEERDEMRHPNKVKNMVVLLTVLSRTLIEYSANSVKIMRYVDKAVNEILEVTKTEDLQKLEIKILKELFEIYEKDWQENNFVVNKIINHVNINLDTSITVKSVAEYLNLSISYVSHIFKKEKNISLKSFIIIRKIDRAKQLLEVGEKTPVEISEQLYFNSYSYFCRVFKNKTGFTPKQYKALHR